MSTRSLSAFSADQLERGAPSGNPYEAAPEVDDRT